jgi:RNA polymerase sigma factor (sigma-70 family)
VDRGDTGQLVTSAASGDAGAWQLIVERLSGLVWSVIRAYRLGSADAADVFQTTWLRLAEHIGRIEQPDRVGAWLATAARRECLQCLRSAGRTVPTDDASWLEGPPVLDNPTEAAILRAEQQQEDAARDMALWRAVSLLSERCQQLLRILMASPPPSYAEVAAGLGLPIGSIGPTRARCLQALREQLVASGITDSFSPS